MRQRLTQADIPLDVLGQIFCRYDQAANSAFAMLCQGKPHPKPDHDDERRKVSASEIRPGRCPRGDVQIH